MKFCKHNCAVEAVPSVHQPRRNIPLGDTDVSAHARFAQVCCLPRRAGSTIEWAMDLAVATLPAVKTKGVLLSDVDGESTPKAKRDSSPVAPPPPPHIRRGRGFAPVFEDMVEVCTVGGERMQFKTKDITTGDLRHAVAQWRDVPASQVQLFCGQSEVSDDNPVMGEQLSVAIRQAPGPALFPSTA